MSAEGKSTIVVRLDPTLLENPDADIRHALPDRLAEISAGAIQGEGYDYGPGDSPQMFIFLAAANLDSSVEQVIQMLRTERMLESDLSSGVVAVESDGGYRVVYPPDFTAQFTVPDD